MNNKKKLFRFIALLSAVSFLLSCSKEETAFVLRNTDELSFSYEKSTKQLTVCTNGGWTLSTNNDWITLGLISGMGDGVKREVIDVMVSRNEGLARSGEIMLKAAGKDLAIIVKQENGMIQFGIPSFSSTIVAEEKIENVYLKIPYKKGYIGQTLNLKSVLSGKASEGIIINDFSTSLDSTEGEIMIPIEGIPSNSGDLTVTVSSSIAGMSSLTLTTKVTNAIYLEQHFNLAVWGGNCVANLPGIRGGFMAGDGGQVIDPSIEVTECTPGTDGSSDLTSTMAPSYRELRGFTGWTGKRVYERPGYVKVGTASSIDGHLITPPLSKIQSNNVKLLVTAKVSQYYQDTDGILYIAILNAGTSSMNEYQMKVGSDRIWENIEFIVTGATSQTQIKFYAAPLARRRFCIDDVVVSKID